MNKDSIRYLWFGIWGALVAASIYILFVGKNAKLKRMLLSVTGVLAAGMGILFFVLADFSREALLHSSAACGPGSYTESTSVQDL